MQRFFAGIASRSAYLMGHPLAFLISALLCLLWAATGPIFGYSDTWQLVINTGTTVLTFLAVFLIQNSQNRDGAAIQAKLDEILRSGTGARSGFIGIEHLTDEEIAQIKMALERKVLQVSEGEPDGGGPTVEELLETCRDADDAAVRERVAAARAGNAGRQSASEILSRSLKSGQTAKA